MLVDRLTNAASYRAIHPRIAAALDYLKKTDFTKVATGRQEIDGDRIFALVMHYDSRLKTGAEFEAHRKYIDVQYVFDGVESMGYAPIEALKVTKPFDETKDAEMLDGEGDFLTVRAGSFVIFWPQDAHMPGIATKAPAPVKKVVVKVMVR